MYKSVPMRMAGALKGVSVLVVEDDPDTLELFILSLSAVGAITKKAASAEAALAILGTWKPDVILCDIQLPGVDGYSLRELVTKNPHLADVPLIAITGSHPSVEAARGLMSGFAKFLLKPAKLPDIVIAVASVVSATDRTTQPPPPGAPTTKVVRSVLATLNAATPCRYTSFLRVDATDKLTSIWTYDRQHPAVDPFPLGLPVHAAYAVLVREARATVAIEDAAADPRTNELEQRLASYVGVPMFRENGSVLGTICCYDEVPHALDQATREAVGTAATELEPVLREIFTSI